MNENWWTMQKLMEARQTEIAKAAQLRLAASGYADTRTISRKAMRNLGQLKRRAGRLLLRWGSILSAETAEGGERVSPLHT
jgi:hypothetical protein